MNNDSHFAIWPFVTFIIIIAAGFILGFFRKTIRSIVTLIGSIVSIIISFLTFDSIIASLEKTILPKFSINNVPLEDVKPLIYTIYALVVFLIVEILLSIIYFIIWLIFLRKFIKPKFLNLSTHKKLIIRLSGSLIFAAASIPFGIFAANAASATIKYNDNFTNKFLSPSISTLSKNKGVVYNGKIGHVMKLNKLMEKPIGKNLINLLLHEHISEFKEVKNEDADKKTLQEILNDGYIIEHFIPIIKKTTESSGIISENQLKQYKNNEELIYRDLENKAHQYDIKLFELNEQGKKTTKFIIENLVINDELQEKIKANDVKAIQLVNWYAKIVIKALTSQKN